ncbi:MAG: EI24 domain-containing protein [Bdellovibrionota bacterium]
MVSLCHSFGRHGFACFLAIDGMENSSIGVFMRLHFFDGLFAIKEGWTSLRQSPRIRNRTILPVVLSILIFFLTLSVSLVFFSDFQDWFAHWFLELWGVTTETESLIWWKKILVFGAKGVSWMLSSLILLTAGLTVPYLVSNLLCSWFWENVSYTTMKEQGVCYQNIDDPSSWKKWITPVFREFIKEVVLLAIVAFAWVVTILPGIGPMISLIMAPLAACIWFGYMVSDYSMSTLQWSVRKRLLWARKNVFYLVGLGIFALIPLAGFVMFPVLLVGHSSHFGKRLLVLEKFPLE